MSDGYTLSHQGSGKGASYDASFSQRNYRRLVWEWERSILDLVATEIAAKSGPPSHLDFACGTARVLAHLEDKVGSSVGVDVSSSMLEVARKNVDQATLIEANIVDGDTSALPHADFGLITSFRFFLNAEPELRLKAIKAISALLADDGRLVINNHLNRKSLRGRLLRAFTKARHGDADRYPTLTDAEVVDLLGAAGLEVETTHRYGLWPISPTERTRLPLAAISMFERFAERVGALDPFATYIIYVARPKGSG